MRSISEHFNFNEIYFGNREEKRSNTLSKPQFEINNVLHESDRWKNEPPLRSISRLSTRVYSASGIAVSSTYGSSSAFFCTSPALDFISAVVSQTPSTSALRWASSTVTSIVCSS